MCMIERSRLGIVSEWESICFPSQMYYVIAITFRRKRFFIYLMRKQRERERVFFSFSKCTNFLTKRNYFPAS